MRTIKLSKRRPPLSPIHLLLFRLFSFTTSLRRWREKKKSRRTDNKETFVTSSFVPVRIFITLLSEHHQHLLPASSICDFLFIPVYCHYNLYALDDFYVVVVVVLRSTFSVSLAFLYHFASLHGVFVVILLVGSNQANEK